ncbi:MAG: HAMP domain-containing sensor histidine kinase [Planctomycetota bacterium]|nr:HAMP domain-containing sensor histidine kinase [Planctomycetota bacterium]
MASKLSVRLAALFLLAALVPLAAAAGLSLGLMRESLHEGAERRHQDVATLVSSYVEVWLDSTRDKLQALGEVLRLDLVERDKLPGEPVTRDDLSQLQNVIGPLIDSNERWSKQAVPALELEFYENDRELVAKGEPRGQSAKMGVQNTNWMALNGQPDASAQNLSRKGGRADSDLVQVPQQTGVVYCEPVLEVIGSTPTLAMSVAVGEVGSNFGTLVADLDFTGLREDLSQLAGEGYAIRVQDEAGTALYEFGQLEGELMGTVVALRGPGEAAWTVTVNEELARIEAPLVAMRRQTGIWLTIAALLAGVLSFGLSIGITRPVRALRRAAEAMGQGDLSVRSGLVRSDEIGQLAAAFDTMASALAQLDAAKSEFVGNVSHELRTPLTSMRLSVANLLDGVVGDLDERQQRSLARVQRELDRMIAMVTELLEMARIEAGIVEPAREAVDLRELLEAAGSARRADAELRQLAIVVDGAGSATADPALLRRVVDNLLDNALKFSGPGGSVELTAEGSALRVRDHGRGLDSSEAAQLFAKFHQGQADGVKNHGVGLGLAIVARLVELQGGSVAAVDLPAGESGACFLVRLPAADPAAPSRGGRERAGERSA